MKLMRRNLRARLRIRRSKHSKRAAVAPPRQTTFDLFPEWESLEAGYAAMASDEAAQAEALEWSEALLVDIDA